MDFFYSHNKEYDAVRTTMTWEFEDKLIDEEWQSGHNLTLYYKGDEITYFLSDDELLNAVIIQDDTELELHILSLVCQNKSLDVKKIHKELAKYGNREVF